MSDYPLPPQDTANYTDMMVYADNLGKYLSDLHRNILTSISGTRPGVTDEELHRYRNLSDTLIVTLLRFNKVEAASRAIGERLDLAERALNWHPAFAIQVVTIDTGSSVEPLQVDTDSDRARLRRILEQGSQKLPIQNELDHWICRNAFDLRRKLASDDVERRQLDLAIINTLVHGASVILESNPDLTVARLEEAAGLAKDRLGDAKRSGELLKMARTARIQLGPGLPNAASIKFELEQILIRAIQRQHAQRFLPSLRKLIAYHSAPTSVDDTILNRLLRDNRLVVDINEIEQRKARFSNDGLVSYLQTSHRDNQDNLRGSEDPREGLRFLEQHVIEIVHAIGEIWTTFEKQDQLKELEIISYLQYSIPQFDLSLTRHGIQQHFVGDYISSIHILVPQLESLIVQVAEQNGIVTIRLDDQKREEISPLPSLLAPRRTDVMDLLSEGVFWFARIFLVESRCRFNLRNKVAHGLISPKECNATISATLVFLIAKIAERSIQMDNHSIGKLAISRGDEMTPTDSFREDPPAGDE